MNSLDQVPFQTQLGLLDEEVQLVAAPVIVLPDCEQILRDTEYGFKLENWVLSGPQPVLQRPSCPPYWLMFGSAPETRRAAHGAREPWGPSPRPRSHSLTSADARRLHQRTVRFLISDSEDEDGYCEDNEGSSSEDARRRVRSRERPRGENAHLHSCVYHRVPESPHSRRRSALECRPAGRGSEPHRSQLESQKKSSRRRERPPTGRGLPQSPAPAHPPPCRLQQQRPSSAGALVKSRRQVLRSGAKCGPFLDSAADLLSALSLEERELLESVTERGYPLRTAVLALQKSGYRSAEKILKYLEARHHLCELGYDEAQVEEALEMFQSCESKAAEFLHLLNQFNEMGFQQNAIKEVLLVHENHRERALEELM
ncbi:unnamed protein product, partial [Tetraodon nigroviridis]